MSPITLTLTGIAHGGEAFGHHQGKITFVPYAIPGETVALELVEDKPRWARARLLQVLEPSPDRVEAPCPYFGPGLCGGCQWQHMAYERQLALKAEVVADQLRRLGGIPAPPVQDLIALADDEGLLAYGYRNHVQFVADAAGQLGFVREASGRSPSGPAATGVQESPSPRRRGQRPQPIDVLPVDACLLLHPLLDEMHAALVAGAADASSPMPDVTEDEDGAQEQEPMHVRRVSLRAGTQTGQRLLVFETVNDQVPGFFIEDLAVSFALRRRDGSIQALIGDPWTEEYVAGRTFRVSAGSFFQVNSVGAAAMVDLAAEMLALAGHEILLDGYCGVGLFALSLAGQVGQVIGIEESESACEDFAWNARDLDNVSLHEGPVAEVLATFDGSEGVDVAIIDPPRSGAGPEVVAHLRRLAVPKLLYVACDPATLARDARLLVDAGYRLQVVQPIDMFPQTYHVECLALFTL